MGMFCGVASSPFHIFQELSLVERFGKGNILSMWKTGLEPLLESHGITLLPWEKSDLMPKEADVFVNPIPWNRTALRCEKKYKAKQVPLALIDDGTANHISLPHKEAFSSLPYKFAVGLLDRTAPKFSPWNFRYFRYLQAYTFSPGSNVAYEHEILTEELSSEPILSFFSNWVHLLSKTTRVNLDHLQDSVVFFDSNIGHLEKIKKRSIVDLLLERYESRTFVRFGHPSSPRREEDDWLSDHRVVSGANLVKQEEFLCNSFVASLLSPVAVVSYASTAALLEMPLLPGRKADQVILRESSKTPATDWERVEELNAVVSDRNRLEIIDL